LCITDVYLGAFRDKKLEWKSKFRT